MSFCHIPVANGWHVGGCGCHTMRTCCGHVPAAINIFSGCCGGGCCSGSAFNWASLAVCALPAITNLIGVLRGGCNCCMGMFGNMFGNMFSGGIYGGGYAAGATSTSTTSDTKTDEDKNPIEKLGEEVTACITAEPQKDEKIVEDLYIRVKGYVLKDELDTIRNNAELALLIRRLETYMKGRKIEIPADSQESDPTSGQQPPVSEQLEPGTGSTETTGTTNITVVTNITLNIDNTKLGDDYTSTEITADTIQLATDGNDIGSDGKGIEKGNDSLQDVVRKPNNTDAVKLVTTNDKGMPTTIKITTSDNNTYTYDFVFMANNRAIYKATNDENGNYYVLIKKGGKFYLTQPFGNNKGGRGKKDTQCDNT